MKYISINMINKEKKAQWDLFFFFFCFPWLELILTKRQSRYSNSQNHWDIPLQDDKQRADLVCTYYLLSNFLKYSYHGFSWLIWQSLADYQLSAWYQDHIVHHQPYNVSENYKNNSRFKVMIRSCITNLGWYIDFNISAE